MGGPMGLYRQGRHNPQNVYFQAGPKPSDKDLFVLVVIEKDLAESVVVALNYLIEREGGKDAGRPPDS